MIWAFLKFTTHEEKRHSKISYEILDINKGERQSIEAKYPFSNWQSTCKNMNLYSNFTLISIINLKKITALNVKFRIIKLLIDNIAENLKNFVYVNYFSDTTHK